MTVARRVLPHDLDAERLVLGAGLVDNALIGLAAGIVQPSDFFRDAHRLIFRRMVDLCEQGIAVDPVTLKTSLTSREVDDVGGIAYIAGLAQGMPKSANVAAYATIVRDKAERRRTIENAKRVVDAAYAGDADAIDGALAVLSEARHRPTQGTPHVVLTADDLIATPNAQSIIEGIAFARCVTVLVSESGTGKTFVAISLAAAVSDNCAWLGRHVSYGSVLIVTFERDDYGTRLRAIREHQGARLEHVHFVSMNDPLTRPGDTDRPATGELDLIATVQAILSRIHAAGWPPLRLIVIDTARASMAGDENSSSDVAAYMRMIHRVMAHAPGAAVILTHHAGWQDGETRKARERGSSAWRGNSDVVLYLEAGKYDRDSGTAELALSVLKTRDAERAAPLRLVRKRVDTSARNALGWPVTSCIIAADGRSREALEAERAAALKADQDALDLHALRLIATRPDIATSVNSLRAALNVRKELVGHSIARLLQAGFITKKNRQPYQVTTAGFSLLKGAAA